MPNPPAVPIPATWAEVRTHDRVIRYQRSGAGQPVVALVCPDSEALWPELIDTLGARGRLIVPEPPPRDTGIGSWLADFLEGLGLAGATLIAAADYCIPALELALLGTDQIARLVLVPDGDVEQTGLDGTVAASVGTVSVALLVVRRGVPPSEAIELVVRFLAGDGVSVPG
jgi:hypothetical protein